MQHQDLQQISGVPSAAPWTKEEYDQAVENVGACDINQKQAATSEKRKANFGVSHKCAFNSLKSFHCVGQFPFDALHDILEKTVAFDGASIVKALVKSGVFSLAEYNRILSNLCLEGYENSDRPPQIKEPCNKLPGKALAVALQFRLMPYILQQLRSESWMAEHMDLWNLLLMLHKLNEYIQADCLSFADPGNFEELWISYLECRKLCQEKYSTFINITPRFHFIDHYKQQMENFGPLNCVWTARPEGKHRVFVNISEKAKNFINLPKTLAVKNQKTLAFR